MKAVFYQAIFEGALTRKDGTILTKHGAQELSPDKMALMFAHMNKHIFVAIKGEDFTPEERELIEGLKAEPSKIQTPSQKQRSILFRIWQHNNKGYKEFKGYYQYRMDLIHSDLKQELDDLTIGY